MLVLSLSSWGKSPPTVSPWPVGIGVTCSGWCCFMHILLIPNFLGTLGPYTYVNPSKKGNISGWKTVRWPFKMNGFLLLPTLRASPFPTMSPLSISFLFIPKLHNWTVNSMRQKPLSRLSHVLSATSCEYSRHPLSNDRLIPSFDVAGDFVHVVFSSADGKLHEDGKYVWIIFASFAKSNLIIYQNEWRDCNR